MAPAKVGCGAEGEGNETAMCRKKARVAMRGRWPWGEGEGTGRARRLRRGVKMLGPGRGERSVAQERAASAKGSMSLQRNGVVRWGKAVKGRAGMWADRACNIWCKARRG